MADIKLSAVTRTEFGKGAARRLRRAGQTPAVLYGHGTETVHLALPARETFLALRAANALITLTLDGDKPVLALPKQVQRHPILPLIEHVDLVLVSVGEKVSVDVPLNIVGEAERGGMVNQDITSLTVLAPATNIPTELEVSIEGLEVGAQITVADLKLPEGVEADVDGETLVVSIVVPPSAEGETAEGEAAEGDAAAE